MITCNRCGFKTPEGAFNCPKCGAPLSNTMEYGFSSRKEELGQPELPAWLESLKVGDRQTAAADSPDNFSAAELFDEGALPNWMHSNSGITNPGFSSPMGTLPPSGPSQSGKLTAQSLIDEKALPSWMQENTSDAASSAPQQGMAASSLVQPDAVPEWMKSLQQGVGTAKRMPSAPLQNPEPTMPPAPPVPSAPKAEATTQVERGFSPGELIDEQALPEWLKKQQDQHGGNSADGGYMNPPGKISPASLLDMDALPSWMQESEQAQSRQPEYPSPASPSASPWSREVQPPPAYREPSNAGGGMAASSFVDMNALPDWLRSASGSLSGGQPAPDMRGGSPAYPAPPRVENVRVPSRPRHEVNPNENSEAAANVFASMLGVASGTPQPPRGPGNQSAMTQQNGQPMSQPMAYPGQGSGASYSQPQQPNYMQGGYGNSGYPGGNNANVPPVGSYNSMPDQQHMTGEQRTKKRGLVDSLRDWLFR